ncbi:metal ABC transporter ATP-binding protein [Nitriliruptoraceae bacterium ZYF776]|nr:metal ABC transporter ATP-binding protein [Profundirhabdus halotolerans]
MRTVTSTRSPAICSTTSPRIEVVATTVRSTVSTSSVVSSSVPGSSAGAAPPVSSSAAPQAAASRTAAPKVARRRVVRAASIGGAPGGSGTVEVWVQAKLREPFRGREPGTGGHRDPRGTRPPIPPPRAAEDTPVTDAIRTRGLTVTYGGHTAVRDLDLAVPAGAVTAVIGPNGSGKSTLLGSISGSLHPAAGSIEVLGTSPARARRRTAHVLQTTVANAAVPLTVLETVRMGCYGRRGAFGRLTREDRDLVTAAVRRLHIGDLTSRQLVELSGGQRQRVYVAQALAQAAELLLLDEPITGLDLVTQEVIAEVIRDEAAAGRTVVLTTHDVGTAALADQVVLMATELVAAGPPDEVLRPETLARAYGSHAHVLPDGTVVLDEAHHHDHQHHEQLVTDPPRGPRQA